MALKSLYLSLAANSLGGNFSQKNQKWLKESGHLRSERQIPYLELFDLWMGRCESWVRAHMNPDALHPNLRGYQALRQDVLNWEPFSQFG